MNMKEKLTRPALWNGGATAGLVLGGISIAYMFISQSISSAGSNHIAIKFLSFVLWTAKLLGCIWLMAFFMKRTARKYEDVSNKDIFKFGVIVSLCSAILYSGITLANMLFISEELYSTQIQAALQTYSGLLDSNSRDMMDKIIQILPQYTFFVNLIYCFIYGLIVSAILSQKIPSKDPFEEIQSE